MRVQTLSDAMTPTQRWRTPTARGNQKFTTQVLESFAIFCCIMKSADVTSTVRYIVRLEKALVSSLTTYDPTEYSQNVH